MDKRLEEIEERLKKTTEGPWSMDVHSWSHYLRILGCRVIEMVSMDDTSFIINAREDIPYLLSIIRQQREALEMFCDAYDRDDGTNDRIVVEGYMKARESADKVFSLTTKTEEKNG